MKRIPWTQIICWLLIAGLLWATWFMYTSAVKQNQQQAQQQHNNEMFIDQCVAAHKHVSSVNVGVYPNVESYLVCQ